ncbi:MAG: HypC/HybG/HupF family hydrogenase formation chaperone [Candidatus Electrothrix aestuarii]|uniref:HypC/HybG/HupF family hydrogenase formation chaperone n=1 Tax=Candidatus Electrothrix aestuarii TaxID=3062594 RepID=A0AAU8LX58_9BACT|nr:HypC/HybG/HupF family hydrogenase formation chaperone [Candidatus Electrothrix aestuarii]
MCLAIPGKLTEIYQKDKLRMAKIDFGGVAKEICLEFVPEAELGDYALVHAGFAISLMNETEAQENIQLIQEVSRFDDEVS